MPSHRPPGGLLVTEVATPARPDGVRPPRGGVCERGNELRRQHHEVVVGAMRGRGGEGWAGMGMRVPDYPTQPCPPLYHSANKRPAGGWFSEKPL